MNEKWFRVKDNKLPTLKTYYITHVVYPSGMVSPGYILGWNGKDFWDPIEGSIMELEYVVAWTPLPSATERPFKGWDGWQSLDILERYAEELDGHDILVITGEGRVNWGVLGYDYEEEGSIFLDVEGVPDTNDPLTSPAYRKWATVPKLK